MGDPTWRRESSLSGLNRMILSWMSFAAARHGLINPCTREWFTEQSKGGSLTTYVFRAGEAGPVMGYAAVSFRNQPHPDDESDSKAKDLVISMLGVNEAFQGKTNPLAAGQSYAASIMADLEEHARSKANCVALKLWVRSTNGRAIRFYTKDGFIADPVGPFQLDDGDPMLTMRKFLR